MNTKSTLCQRLRRLDWETVLLKVAGIGLFVGAGLGITYLPYEHRIPWAFALALAGILGAATAAMIMVILVLAFVVIRFVLFA